MNNQEIIGCDIETYHKFLNNEIKGLEVRVDEEWFFVVPQNQRQGQFLRNYRNYSHTYSTRNYERALRYIKR